jgi:hypothetical protein
MGLRLGFGASGPVRCGVGSASDLGRRGMEVG